jgi:SAM-dependent methyltransferase
MEGKKWGDPIGKGILDYTENRRPGDIIVMSDICDDDIIPLEVLFRKFDEMPELEKRALEECDGKVLDVGAGAGAHTTHLIKELDMDVQCIEISPGAVEYLQEAEIPVRQINFFDVKDEKYDTVLMLMNGIGIAGTLSNLEKTLLHAKSLLTPSGKIICDSSDIKYLYEDEDGSMLVNLNAEYYGNFRFKMKYKSEVGTWFDWLYVDFDTLFRIAKKVGLHASKLYDEDDHFLTEIKVAE